MLCCSRMIQSTSSNSTAGIKVTGIDICSEKAIGVDTAKTLYIPFFESATLEETKIKTFNDFAKGRLQTLVATTAFGAGIDIPTVDLVIHARSPRSMVDFAQESGRA